MIEFKNFTKKYGDNVAVDNLTLTINDGEIFGLIGHNGAGKSTTIKALVDIISPSEGDILIDDKSVCTHDLSTKKKIAYIADSPDIFLTMNAVEYWHFLSVLYDIKDYQRDIDELCAKYEFINLYSPIEELSHGNRQKVFILGALLIDPEIWILDEPLTGLDPVSGYNLKEAIKKHRDNKKTVLFSTHDLNVAQNLCDRIGILKNGKLVYVGTTQELLNKYENKSLEEIYINILSKEEKNE